MKIKGRSCTLTVAKDGEFYPLPFSEETVRETSKGYVLPPVIGKRNRQKYVETRRVIEGCFVTRLDSDCILGLFLLFFNDDGVFDLYADRVVEKIVYKNVCVTSFELRTENGGAFKLRMDVGSTDDFFTTSWPINTPDLSLRKIVGSNPTMTQNRTYFYDGHFITINDNNKPIPLIYRF